MQTQSVVLNIEEADLARLTLLATSKSTTVQALLQDRITALLKKTPSNKALLISVAINESLAEIAKMPLGTKFTSRELVPPSATPVQARVFGRRLYTAIKRTNACTTVLRFGSPIITYVK